MRFKGFLSQCVFFSSSVDEYQNSTNYTASKETSTKMTSPQTQGPDFDIILIYWVMTWYCCNMYTHILDDEVLISRWFPRGFHKVCRRWIEVTLMHIGSGEGWIDVTLNIVSAQGPLESSGGQVGKLKLEFWEVPNIYKYDQICKYTCIYEYIYMI